MKDLGITSMSPALKNPPIVAIVKNALKRQSTLYLFSFSCHYCIIAQLVSHSIAINIPYKCVLFCIFDLSCTKKIIIFIHFSRFCEGVMFLSNTSLTISVLINCLLFFFLMNYLNHLFVPLQWKLDTIK